MPLSGSGCLEWADVGETRVKMQKKTYKMYKEGLNELGTQLVTRGLRQDLHVKPKVNEKAATQNSGAS